MKRIFRFLAISMVILTSCTSKTIVLESPDGDLDMNSQEESVVLGKASDLDDEDIKNYLTNWLDTLKIEEYVEREDIQEPIYEELRRFYKFNLYQLAWSNKDTPNSNSKALLGALAEAKEHGLNPDDYDLRELVYKTQQVYSRRRQVNLIEVIQLDMNMSIAYLKYTQHLFNGRLNPEVLGGEWEVENKNSELAAYLAGKDVGEVLAMVVPKIEGYSQLKEQLANFRSIAERGGWNTIDEATDIKEGDRNDDVYYLRQRLERTGDLTRSLSKQSGNTSYWDAALTEAMRNFQRRHGLEVTGLLDPPTLREINRPVEERIEQIKVNLERLRWMPRRLEEDRIMINVPAYSLKLYYGNRLESEHRVLVGQEFSPTPIFQADLDYIVFSPSWNVSGTIFYRELLPEAKKDPDFLRNNGYELYASIDDVGKRPLDIDRIDWSRFSNEYPHFKVVQRPGPGKEVGQIKFVLPNDFNIFLSDASSENLFDRAKRDLNYRCISVENASELAVTLLDDRKWKIGKVNESMQSEVPVKASLKEKLPVYITYRTAWVDENGQVNFRRDVYGYDAAQYQLTQPEETFESDF